MASFPPAARCSRRNRAYTAPLSIRAASFTTVLSFSFPKRSNRTPTAPEISLDWSVASTLPRRMLP